MLARTMGNGPGTMGLALLPFLGLWVVMMAAMVLPSVAPVAVLWTRLITGVLAIWFPWLLPGLHVSSMPSM
jgi:predicted metal-binding membrane protein